MINAKPGYWDVDRCSWVGVDPMYVVPPLRHAEHAHRAAAVPVPEPRPAPAEPVTGDVADRSATTA